MSAQSLKKKLTLKKETLRTLETVEPSLLEGVVGGAGLGFDNAITLTATQDPNRLTLKTR
ncbi:hypothetical protein SAMN05443572_1011381 [Myxococcus fulvus]|uniref:Uncharacterized protein n=1 Tax=Myxococcus fulvus TaxID=33 RepID=A0A511ST15_MYXFU|nr:hypothetical protein [Myxococcus fulvus]AKF84981.1 hypothetical protein MFUL124B02_07795 [Myxococcus fulvus 124B02]GEN05075.1 hypothetical protein MFU01_01120 [Myxococcus fulvus]SET18839.1 hypothetical protein SAMN05443572_1011381 [Myxococcus fulvus]